MSGATAAKTWPAAASAMGRLTGSLALRANRRRSIGDRRPDDDDVFLGLCPLYRSLGLCAVLAAPGEQGGREVRGGTPLELRAWRNRSRIRIRGDHRAIEMPGGMAEQRDHDGQTEEERQRSQHQQRRDD